MTDSIAATLREAAAVLAGDSARLDAELLLAHVLEKDRTWLFTWADKTLSESQRRDYAALLAERQQGVPVAYLIGEQEFWSLPLKVTPATLIPRPETEQLVDFVLQQHDHHQPLQLLDAGTGSGAIAIALAHECPCWSVSACDYSEQALQVAQQNASRHRLAIRFFQNDWLAGLEAASLDVIVANPPYIRAGDEHLPALRYEPYTALVAADDGLADIKTLARQAQQVLRPGGALYIEHGYDQGQAVQAIFRANGFVEVSCEQDYAGNDRFTHGVKAHE